MRTFIEGKNIVVVGATSAIATHCLRQWALQTPASISLIGRNHSALSQLADDLRVYSPSTKISFSIVDFENTKNIADSVQELISAVEVDLVLIAHGYLPEQQQCQGDLIECERALWVNGISPVLFAEAFAKAMVGQRGGIIALIGSVAGDRGRKSNYVYGAAKAMMERYAQGLQHRFHGSGVKVVLIKPGPTDTPMTAAIKGSGLSLAPVEQVATEIVKGLEKGRHVIYAPWRWAFIMFIIRQLPRSIFGKMDI